MHKFLGIDVGGTNVKCGTVTPDGKILKKVKFETKLLREQGDFPSQLLKVVKKMLEANPEVKDVGLGLPGTLDKYRTRTIEIPNIPELNHINLKERLIEHFPGISFSLENDANAAALGELIFSKKEMPDNFIFVTMGTGIGGAAIIDKKIFVGGEGNSMEIGHMMSEGGIRLENLIGKRGILELARRNINAAPTPSLLANTEILSSKILIEAASRNDQAVLETFREVGYLLGSALVSIIRILDIKHVFIGGGISASFKYIQPTMAEVIKKNLTPYYLKPLTIKRATLGNRAGVLGAASLCFQKVYDEVRLSQNSNINF